MRRLGITPRLKDFLENVLSVNDWLATVTERLNIFKSELDPTVDEIPENQWVVHKNTTSSTLSIWANDEGTLVYTPLGASGTGDVRGPAGAVADNVVFFDGTSGKLIKDSGLTLSGNNTGDQTSIAGITGTMAEFNAAVTDGNFAFGGGTVTGTNTGDQTSIVGISGTKAQFDTACTDGNFLYVGDVTQYTDEMAQDAVGNILVDSSTIDFTYADATPSITAIVKDASLGVAKLSATGSPSSSTYLRGDGTWSTPGSGSMSGVSAVLTATQSNSTTTMAVLTGHTFTVNPGQTLMLTGQGAFTSAAATTAIGLGIRVAQAAASGGNAQGSAAIQVHVASAAGTTQWYDGDVFDVAAGGSSLFEVVPTASTAGNNGASYQAMIKNNGTSGTVTVTVEFRSEVAASAVTAQIGTGATGILF